MHLEIDCRSALTRSRFQLIKGSHSHATHRSCYLQALPDVELRKEFDCSVKSEARLLYTENAQKFEYAVQKATFMYCSCSIVGPQVVTAMVKNTILPQDSHSSFFSLGCEALVVRKYEFSCIILLLSDMCCSIGP